MYSMYSNMIHLSYSLGFSVHPKNGLCFCDPNPCAVTGEFEFLTTPSWMWFQDTSAKTYILFQDLNRLLLSHAHFSFDCWKRPDFSRTSPTGIMFAKLFFLPISLLCLLLGVGAFLSPSVPVLQSSTATTRRTSSLRMVSHPCDVRHFLPEQCLPASEAALMPSIRR